MAKQSSKTISKAATPVNLQVRETKKIMLYTQKNAETQIDIGKQTRIGENVTFGPSCKTISIGFGCFLGRDLYIDVEHLTIGDYTTIHHGGIIHGIETSIGHNCWFGHYCIIDSLGGLTRIGNNVGAGAHSQLWSHMKFGDMLAGCRWNSSGSLILEDDVWLVGHSITGPIKAAKRSMLMTGSVAVKDLEENHIYSGSPAKDITAHLGLQFDDPDLEQRQKNFASLKAQYAKETGLSVEAFLDVSSFDPVTANVTQFNLMERTYRPRYTQDEYGFMRFLLYDRAKFVPVN
ncbi:hypothetical protein I5192_22065 (plasmid) [Ruegeria sp. SCSIO 43209]|uniref:acyltransferase n=1 Tax=Ruegeria sp. SCSIO 43209 TaxID=2793010 RepID=UPI00147E3FDB|nr:hypothetical protein [Ruegeria sp. SCSIO 43209]UAB91762.1 hypothetical protein I5192_22065 [Ruegeria sp. SCSIO 43209]